jgi:hypothetical protein
MTVLTQRRFLDYASKVAGDSDVPEVVLEDWGRRLHPYDRLAIHPYLYEKFIYKAPMLLKSTPATKVRLLFS